jgi:hypothetical protein
MERYFRAPPSRAGREAPPGDPGRMMNEGSISDEKP